MKMLSSMSDFNSMKSCELIKLECKMCEKEFDRKKKYVKDAMKDKSKSTLEYCSTQCSSTAQRSKRIKLACLQCNETFEKTEYRVKVGESKFCSQSCAASYNNSNAKSDRKFGPAKTIFWRCLVCSCDIEDNRLYCKDHTTIKPLDIEKTIEELEYKKGEVGNRFGVIRSHARRTAKAHGLIDECFLCGYKNTVQVCHIVSVAKFPKTSKLKEINSPNNLIGLCPNHHWDLDHNMLSIEDKDKIKQSKL